tara:strand:- start:10227 stop:11993 length:1767 start_codon:yes stop_codon:yes gene_type:complete
MKLSDYVIEKIADIGVKHVFMLPGGGAMHLNDSLGRSKRIDFICNIHEQASAIAADAYSQYTNNIGVCMVTTGPGSMNTLTGVAASWMDSIPLLVICGQVKMEDLSRGKGLRQLGFQEIDIDPIVKSFTKYAVTVTDPSDIRYHVEKAIWMAKSLRKGPSWLAIPLDIQASEIDPNNLKSFDPEKEGLMPAYDKNWVATLVKKTLNMLSNSVKPIILVGNGVRLAGARDNFIKMARLLKVPILTTWKALDFLAEDDPLYVGRPGLTAQRAANLSQQDSDWFLILGARMDMGQTAYNHKYLAPNAKRIMVDVDNNEIKKMNTEIHLPVPISADIFINEMIKQIEVKGINKKNWESWRNECINLKNKYPLVINEHWTYKDGVSIYAFLDTLSDEMKHGDVLAPGSSGMAIEVTMQAFKSKKGVRVFNSEGMGSMGFGISAALGGCLASNLKNTICIDGDGGFAMNTQELETIKRLKLPIKFFVLDNDGYASIRATQERYFQGRFYGSSKEGGMTLPSLKKISFAFGIKYFEILSSNEIKPMINKVLSGNYPTICKVVVSPQHRTEPRVKSSVNKAGKIETSPMQNMWPEL